MKLFSFEGTHTHTFGIRDETSFRFRFTHWKSKYDEKTQWGDAIRIRQTQTRSWIFYLIKYSFILYRLKYCFCVATKLKWIWYNIRKEGKCIKKGWMQYDNDCNCQLFDKMKFFSFFKKHFSVVGDDGSSKSVGTWDRGRAWNRGELNYV